MSASANTSGIGVPSQSQVPSTIPGPSTTPHASQVPMGTSQLAGPQAVGYASLPKHVITSAQANVSSHTTADVAAEIATGVI